MISEEQLNSISELVKSQPISEQIVAGLRNSYPDLHFTYCMMMMLWVQQYLKTLTQYISSE